MQRERERETVWAVDEAAIRSRQASMRGIVSIEMSKMHSAASNPAGIYTCIRGTYVYGGGVRTAYTDTHS